MTTENKDIEISEDRVGWILERIKKTRNAAMSTTLIENNTQAMEYYIAEELNLKEKKQISKAIVPVVRDTINWVVPIMMEIFAGSEEIFGVKPRGAEDVKDADLTRSLVDYQLRVKNKWTQFVHDIFQDAAIYRRGIAKTQWIKEIKFIDKEFEDESFESLQAKLIDKFGKERKDIEIIEKEEIEIAKGEIDAMGIMISPPVYSYNVTLRYRIEDDYPLVECIPPEDIGLDWECDDQDNLTFIYHDIRYHKWEIIKKYGEDVFDQIKENKEVMENGGMEAIRQARLTGLGGIAFLYDKEDGKYLFKECAYIDPDTGDYFISVISGDEEVAHFRNPYDRLPYRIATPFRIAHRLCGMSFHDYAKKFQDLQSAIIRNAINNILSMNNGKYAIDTRKAGVQGVDDFLKNNVPGGIIRVVGNPNEVIMNLTPPQLHPWLFKLHEEIQNIIEVDTGVPRAFKGVDISELNKTFRGQQQQITQASQMIKMMARMFAETFFAPLVKDVINMNAKFLKKKTSFRLLNEMVNIEPDNIVTQCDVTINVGLGVDNKDQLVMQFQQLLGLYRDIQKSGIPIINAQNAYNALKGLVKAMRLPNVDDYSSDPKTNEAVIQLVQAIISHINKMGAYGGNMPQAQAMVNELTAPLQRVMANMGMGGDMKEYNKKGSQNTNQERPKQPETAATPMNPITHKDGGGFFG